MNNMVPIEKGSIQSQLGASNEMVEIIRVGRNIQTAHYLEVATAVIVPHGVGKTSPHTSI